MDTVRQKVSDLEHSKANVLRLMDQVTPPTKVEPHPNIGQLYQRRVEQLSHLLNDDSSQQEAVTIIRSLIDRIEITPGVRRGDPQVPLVDGLAAILELAVSGQQKTAIQMDSGIGRILMVAGTGFEPRSTPKQNRSLIPLPVHHRHRFDALAPPTHAPTHDPIQSKSRKQPQ